MVVLLIVLPVCVSGIGFMTYCFVGLCKERRPRTSVEFMGTIKPKSVPFPPDSGVDKTTNFETPEMWNRAYRLR